MQSNIRKLRKRQGLTQKELGEQIGVSQQIVSRMEQDRELISTDILLKLADFFKVSTDCVLGIDEFEKESPNWMQEMIVKIIGKRDVLILLERANNFGSREWLYLWYLIQTMNERP